MKNILFLCFFCFYVSLFAQIPSQNLQLWVKGDSVEIINGKVSIWYDLSGNDFHLIQNNDSKRPTQNISILNNFPVLTFDGNDYLISNPGIVFAQPITVFTVWKTLSASEQTLIDNLAYPNHFLDNSRGTGVRMYALGEVSYLKSNPFDFILTTGIYNFNTSKLYENNILKKLVMWVLNQFMDFCIGYRSAYNDRYFKGSVAEIIIYDTLLNDSSINLINNYLMDKYAPPVKLIDTLTNDFLCSFILTEYPFTLKPKGYFTSYQWSTGATSDSILVVNDGVYSVTATDIFGRVSTDSIRVYFMSPYITHRYFLLLWRLFKYTIWFVR